jgi:hypothetical protein
MENTIGDSTKDSRGNKSGRTGGNFQILGGTTIEEMDQNLLTKTNAGINDASLFDPDQGQVFTSKADQNPLLYQLVDNKPITANM